MLEHEIGAKRGRVLWALLLRGRGLLGNCWGHLGCRDMIQAVTEPERLTVTGSQGYVGVVVKYEGALLKYPHHLGRTRIMIAQFTPDEVMLE